MPNDDTISAECLTPILYVRDFDEAITYYTKKTALSEALGLGQTTWIWRCGLGKG